MLWDDGDENDTGNSDHDDYELPPITVMTVMVVMLLVAVSAVTVMTVMMTVLVVIATTVMTATLIMDLVVTRMVIMAMVAMITMPILLMVIACVFVWGHFALAPPRNRQHIGTTNNKMSQDWGQTIKFHTNMSCVVLLDVFLSTQTTSHHDIQVQIANCVVIAQHARMRARIVYTSVRQRANVKHH